MKTICATFVFRFRREWLVGGGSMKQLGRGKKNGKRLIEICIGKMASQKVGPQNNSGGVGRLIFRGMVCFPKPPE